MAKYLSTNDVIQLNNDVIERTARCLGVYDKGKTMLELFDTISKTEDTLYDLADDLICSYRQYQNFNEYIEHENAERRGVPVIIRQDNLNQLIEARNQSREALIAELKHRES